MELVSVREQSDGRRSDVVHDDLMRAWSVSKGFWFLCVPAGSAYRQAHLKQGRPEVSESHVTGA